MLKRKKYIKLTQKELNSIENKAYLQGYEQGIKEGKLLAVWENNTMNTIRALFDLPPLEKFEKVHPWVGNAREMLYGNAAISPRLNKEGEIIGLSLIEKDGE